MGMWVWVNVGVGTITATEGAMWVHSKKNMGTNVKTLEISGYE